MEAVPTLARNATTKLIVTKMTHEPNGHWSIPFLPPNHEANDILRIMKMSIELANYHHASLGSPAKSTLLQAICLGHLVTCCGLTTKLISRNLAPNIVTALGHQDQEPQNLHSTQKPLTPEPTIHHSGHDLAPVNEPCSNIISSMLFPPESKWVLFWPNRKFSFKIYQGKSLHFHPISLWQKHYPCNTHS